MVCTIKTYKRSKLICIKANRQILPVFTAKSVSLLVPPTLAHNVTCFVEIRSVCAEHVLYFSRTSHREAKQSYRGVLVTEISEVWS